MSEAPRTPDQVKALSEEQRWHWAEGTKFVIEAGKALMLINGGAAISILTFLGNKQIQSPPSVNAIFCFALGALFAAALFGSSYATQLYYGNSAGGSSTKPALIWHAASVAFSMISTLAFLVGMILAAKGLGSVAVSSPPCK